MCPGGKSCFSSRSSYTGRHSTAIQNDVSRVSRPKRSDVHPLSTVSDEGLASNVVVSSVPSGPFSWMIRSNSASLKGRIYPGEHQAIVSRELWDRVHATLQESPR